MPWLQVNPEGGLGGWGPPPQLTAGHMALAVAEQIRARQQQAQLQQEEMNKLAQMMQQQRNNQIADTLSQQYFGDDTGGGVYGLQQRMLRDQMQAQAAERQSTAGLRSAQAGYYNALSGNMGAASGDTSDQGGVVYDPNGSGIPGRYVMGRYGKQWQPLPGPAIAVTQPNQPPAPNKLQQAGYAAEDLAPSNLAAGDVTKDSKGNSIFTKSNTGGSIMIGGQDVPPPSGSGPTTRVGGDIVTQTELQRMRRLLAPQADKNVATGYGLPTQSGGQSQDQFVVGQSYQDAQGNTAVYQGNGQWKSQ